MDRSHFFRSLPVAIVLAGFSLPAAAQSKPRRRGSIIVTKGSRRARRHTVEYDSKTVGVRRKMVIYTPPGYSKDSKYPVLYLLHGIGGNHTDWTKQGDAEVILDNLHAHKRIVPMIVVMPDNRAWAPNPGEDKNRNTKSTPDSSRTCSRT